jgi:DedD protein
MARTISDEEQQLRRRARRRLIGAIVLVAAIVVILPMVLDSEPRPSGQPISVQIPPPDPGGFAPKLAPLPPALPGKETPTSKPAVEAPAKIAAVPAPEPAKEVPAPPKEAAVPVKEPAPAVAETPKEAPAPAAKPKPKASKPPAAPKGGGYVIQVIALADAGKAREMQQQIAGAGIKSYTEVVKTAKGDVTRVRAGPFASRSAAEKARDQLKALGMNGNITTK